MMPPVTYQYRLTRPKCDPFKEVLHVIADISEDISGLLPYLNEVLDGWTYNDSEPSLLINLLEGKAAALYPTRIAMRGMKDEEEAVRYLDWLVGQIEETRARKSEITPRYTSRGVINIMELLMALPRTNCGECGEPTCMAFAAKVRAGELEPKDCLPLEREEYRKNSDAVNSILKKAGWRPLDA